MFDSETSTFPVGHLPCPRSTQQGGKLIRLAEDIAEYGLALFLLAACGTIEAGKSYAVADTQSPVGTKENPIPVGEVGIVGQWGIIVKGVTLNAAEFVDFDDPAPSGHQYVMVRIIITYGGEDTATPSLDLIWAGVGPSNVTSLAYCGFVDDDLADVPAIFNLGTTEANICLDVPEYDVPGHLLIMQVEGAPETRQFFDLNAHPPGR